MARKKNYSAEASPLQEPISIAPLTPARSAVIQLPSNFRRKRDLDLTSWLGKGFDEWVLGCAEAVRARLKTGQFAEATLVSLIKVGAPTFFRYLGQFKALPIPSSPNDLQQAHVAKYVAWLKLKYPERSSARGYFSQFKSLLSAMREIGLIKHEIASLAPTNPFPGTRAVCVGETPLSSTEMERLAAALKKDLIAIHQKKFDGLNAQAISLMLLAIAMRLGVNTTPLMEMKRDCLRPHPFMPNLMLVETFKRRGAGFQSTALRQKPQTDLTAALPMDGVAIIKKALEITKPLSDKAGGELGGNLWLYAINRGGFKKGTILPLTEVIFSRNVAAAMARHGLLADDGSPLRVTIGRLRKTKETRLWRLSDGDLIAVAAAMGHSPQVADNHYLRLDEEGKASAALFIAQELPGRLRGEDLPATPSGRCEDTLNGALAPKNGSTHCANFTRCLGCPSYAIAGTVDDLHRLYSFQVFLERDMDSFVGEEWQDWRESRGSMIKQIDAFTSAKFPASIVEQARQKTAAGVHPFWAIQIRRHLERGESYD